MFEYTGSKNNGNRQGGDSTSSGQQQQAAAAADTCLLDITDCMNFRKFTHKIYHYPQEQLFTYRVAKGVSAAVTAGAAGNVLFQYTYTLLTLCRP